MALPKLFERIFWHNNTTPALNEDNLNAMSKGLDDVDDRLIELAGTIMEDVPQIIEDMATIEAGLETVGQAVTDAQTAATAATADKLKSEGFAVGEQNGVPVDSSSPYYHNNAKYYSQVAPPTAAAHVSYDHSQSHLAATNVQEAVDELKEALTDEAETRAALGAHNLIGYTLAELKTLNTFGTWSNNVYTMTNADFTVNANGTIGVAKGSASTGSNSIILKKDWYIAPGTYILNGNPAGGGTETRRITVWIGGSNERYVFNVGSDVEFTIGENEYIKELNIRIGATTTFTGTISPMIRLATDSDPTYQPYAPTNLQLENNKANKSDLASISITGTTNNTGSTIASGTYFYLNGALVKAKTSIANGATLTANTNYTVVTAGSLNELPVLGDAIEITTAESFANLKNGITYKFSSSATGNPFTGYNVAVKVAKVASTSGVQMAFKVVSTASTELDLLAIRPCLGGDYGAWRKFSGVISS